jgi:hypothetical protein
MEYELDKLNEDVWSSICGDLKDNFETVKREITGNWRHGTEEEIVLQSKSSGKFYMSCFRDTCKEMDFGDMNWGDDANFFEVIPKEETITNYVKK